MRGRSPDPAAGWWGSRLREGRSRTEPKARERAPYVGGGEARAPARMAGGKGRSASTDRERAGAKRRRQPLAGREASCQGLARRPLPAREAAPDAQQRGGGGRQARRGARKLQGGAQPGPRSAPRAGPGRRASETRSRVVDGASRPRRRSSHSQRSLPRQKERGSGPGSGHVGLGERYCYRATAHGRATACAEFSSPDASTLGSDDK